VKATLSTAQVAERVGVHRDTLLRWLREGRVPEPARDRHGWRSFVPNEAEAIERFARKTREPIARNARRPADEIERLRRLDWDFADAKTGYLTHALHPYPAKFIPQIPNALIQELSSVGETVADIFCGSGTTIVEALTLKRNAIGVDANPLACLLSRAKTTHLTTDDTAALEALSAHALSLAGQVEEEQTPLFGGPGFQSNAPRPAADNLQFWFPPFVIEELAELHSWCEHLDTAPQRDIALTALSSIIVSVSHQDSDTRYTRRDKDTRPGDTMRRFARALADATRAATEFTELVEPRFHREIIHANVLDEPNIDMVDLVVCSPPYPNAYSYHLYHRTRMLWLGLDQPTFKKVEIGSHRKYSAKGKNGATVSTFVNECTTIFRWLHQHLRPGRYACFVIGDSILNGTLVDNTSLLARAAAPHGFREVARINRRLQETKRAFNPAIGRIKEEHILILQREGAT
jgi:excisionase family DNA binding protein